MGRTLFGTDIENDDATREIGEALNETLGQFDRAFSLFLPITERLPLPSTLRFRRARDVMDRPTATTIQERRAVGVPADDLLSLLLQARDDDVAMGDAEVRDEAMTSSSPVTRPPRTRSRGRGCSCPSTRRPRRGCTQSSTASSADAPATVGDALPFTDGVVRESMRLYPPAWAIGRRAQRDHVADGVRITPGSVVVVSPWLLHHDERWWPDSGAFRPERWLEGDEARPRHAYIPFGGGVEDVHRRGVRRAR